MKKLTIEYIPVSQAKPHSKNPRKHSKKQVEQIAASIRQFGFTAPILVNAEYQIIAGHGRVLAAQQLGMENIPVVMLENLTAAQVQAYMIADNRLTENSQWDEPLLAQHFLELSKLDLDFHLEITGFETTEIDLMLEGLEAVQAGEEPLPEPSGPAICKPGDIWQLGNHRIYCGNSLEDASYAALLGGDKAGMVFTDPPYNVPVDRHICGLGKVKHREFAMATGEMTPEAFTDFLKRACGLLATYSVDGSLHFICMDWRHMAEMMAAGAQYAEMKNLCVWVKDNGGMGSLYRSQHELVFVFKNGTAPHRNNVELGKNGRYRTNVWEYSGANSFSRQHSEEGDTLALHPTVKPVALIADAILDCTRRNDIVLDAFLGSGSTLIAAEKTGRRCYGIELDPLYVDTAIRRWQAWTGKEATHIASGMGFNALAVEMEACHA